MDNVVKHKVYAGDILALLAKIGRETAELNGALVKDMGDTIESGYESTFASGMASAQSRYLEAQKLQAEGIMGITGGVMTAGGSLADAHVYAKEAKALKAIDDRKEGAPTDKKPDGSVAVHEVNGIDANAPVPPVVPTAINPTTAQGIATLPSDPGKAKESTPTAKKPERENTSKDFKAEHKRCMAISQMGSVFNSIGALMKAAPTNSQAAQDMIKGEKDARAQLASGLRDILNNLLNSSKELVSLFGQVADANMQAVLSSARIR